MLDLSGRPRMHVMDEVGGKDADNPRVVHQVGKDAANPRVVQVVHPAHR